MEKSNAKDFATTGAETFKISGKEVKEHIVLNIQEATEGIILEKEKAKKVPGGNTFIDFFKKINRWLARHSKVKIRDKATFFHLLAVMINAGIPMVRALRSLVAQMDKSVKLQIIVEDIANDIEGGASLSESLLKHPDLFSEQEVGMTQSGEASGQLSKVLDNLAKDTEKAYTIRSKIKSAMIYPIVVFTLLIGVIVAMMIFVIPGLKTLFESTDKELPLITRVVVGISDFMVNQKLAFILGLLGVILFFALFKRTDIGKYAIDKIKISLPLFGALFKKAYLSRFSRTLSNLLDSNISIVRAIEITGNSVGNDVYKKRLLLAMEDVKQGIPLAESLAANPLFPPMLVNMIEVGERTAQLDAITEKVANFYEDEVDTAVAGISKIIEPVILIVIGISVGTVVAAIMLPIMQLANLSEVL